MDRQEETQSGSPESEIQGWPEEVDEGKGVRLKRQLGFFPAVAFICGLVIGTGIWVTPKVIMESTNSVGTSLIMWAMWGVLSIGIGLVYAELGTTFPKSGGKYIYLDEAFGPFVSFLFIWTYVLALRPGANAIKVLTFGIYLLKPVFPDCAVPTTPVLLLALSLLFLITFVHIVNVKAAASGQEFFSGICIFALIGITGIGLFWIGKGRTENFQLPFNKASRSVKDNVMGFYTCYYCYAGMSAANFVIEEVRDPSKILPRAIIASAAIITSLYVLANVAFVAVLGREGVINSDAVASSFAVVTLGSASWVMSILIGLNTAGSLNSGTLIGSRLCFVGARRGLLPSLLHLVNLRFLSPITSLIFLSLMTFLYCLVDISYLLKNLTIMVILVDFLCVGALVWLRYKKPNLHRPIKLPIIIPVVLLVILGGLTLIPLILNPVSAGLGIAIILGTGVPYYVIYVVWKPRVPVVVRVYGSVLRWTQKLVYSAREEHSQYHSQ